MGSDVRCRGAAGDAARGQRGAHCRVHRARGDGDRKRRGARGAAADGRGAGGLATCGDHRRLVANRRAGSLHRGRRGGRADRRLFRFHSLPWYHGRNRSDAMRSQLVGGWRHTQQTPSFVGDRLSLSLGKVTSRRSSLREQTALRARRSLRGPGQPDDRARARVWTAPSGRRADQRRGPAMGSDDLGAEPP